MAVVGGVWLLVKRSGLETPTSHWHLDPIKSVGGNELMLGDGRDGGEGPAGFPSAAGQPTAWPDPHSHGPGSGGRFPAQRPRPPPACTVGGPRGGGPRTHLSGRPST